MYSNCISNFLYLLQLTFRACDSGLPQRCANSTGTINVLRNQFPPIFRNEPYSRTIQDTAVVGSSVLTITATDADQIGTLVYEALTTPYPFELNRLTGVVTLQYQGLLYGPALYTVSNDTSRYVSFTLRMLTDPYIQ
ncbi:hypothetical protein DPMN_036518 [Dreissena polymorpha]|uniref:Cadherin domain-containing protein n=1 Tax=Dreissena polymorpha TaxID=45954 RepID=A0A9D4RLI9_DREPO|nr:hypothetical protein DPMN_036518 [Dreissena polymorpha]